MSSQAQFWQVLRPIRKVGKLRGVIELPVFSAKCGNKSALQIYPSSIVSLGSIYFQPTIEFTVKFWMKLQDLSLGDVISVIFQNSCVAVGVKNGALIVYVLTSDTYSVVSNTTFLLGEWYDIAVTFKDGYIRIYINTVFDAISAATGTGVLNVSGSSYLSGNGVDGFGIFVSTQCYLSGLEAWVIAQSPKEIQDNLYVLPYGPGAVGLKYLFNFREASGNFIKNLVNGVNSDLRAISDPTAAWVNDFPSNHLYNMSFIAGQFTIDTGGKNFSLKFPLVNTDQYNFVLCVTAKNGIRYKLWDNAGFIFAPNKPATYSGQLISNGAKLEVWSLDGNEIVDLAAVLDLETSILHTVKAADSTTRTTDSAPVIDTKLAAAFPLTFPIVFNTQQTYP